ncbi:MAG TPA: FCD domain-containing protein [Baekduia sp.]|uniref:FadR/GntR family transcriptional regulator n=1 Tax=Baekduia sp. TaxID=2600305 RepID=UPI002D76B596|nr:FCD domain-containing protein [Baekduia sp.]HET6509875.1 FCD domain-containing protein [Baekduia sp.]
MAAVDPLTEHLADYIATHALEPGSRLPPERELAAQIGISRSALREATRRLIGVGLLEPRTGSGTYLAEVDHADLMLVRLQLEPTAASLAAARADDAQLAEIRSQFGRLRRLVGRPAAFADADLELHGAIADLSRNRFLQGCLAQLNAVLRLSRARTAPDPQRRAQTVAELDDLVSALLRRDADGAEAAMRAHLLGVRETLG